MGLAQPAIESEVYLYTVDEYLELERAALERHEYLDGRIYLMAGESGAHADICTNLTMEIGTQLKGRPCRARAKDTKVRSGVVSGQGRKGLFSYPDLVVICGEPEYHDRFQDVVTNPTLIIEVLSPSTERFDRHEKFVRYNSYNPTLSDYVLVWQDAPIIEHFSRQSDGSWRYTVLKDLDTVLTLANIGCALTLREIYDRVPFDGTADELLSRDHAAPDE